MKVANRKNAIAGAAGVIANNPSHGLMLAKGQLDEWRTVAGIERKEAQSLKERLSEILGFSPSDHAEYRKELLAERTRMNDAKKATLGDKATMQQYFEANPGTQYLYTRVSDWAALSNAVESGWKPNINLTWGVLKAEAVERNRYVTVIGLLPDDERKLMQDTDKLVSDGKMTLDAQTAKMAAAPGCLARFNTLMAKYGSKAPARAVKAVVPATGQGSSGAPTPVVPTQAGTAAPATPGSVSDGTPPQSAVVMVGGATAQVGVVQITAALEAQPYAVIVGVAAWLEGFMKGEKFAKMKAAYEEAAKATSARVPTANQKKAADPEFKGEKGTIGKTEHATAKGGKEKSGKKSRK